MCGIFGYAKRQNAQNDKQLETIKNVLTNLADESVVRGTDSTGVTMISPTDRRTFKSTEASDDVIQHDTWKSNILDRVTRDNTIAIGHVRLATHGVVTSRNAHPFEIGDVVGAHNGIIYNYNKLAEKYDKDKIEVDSEVIFEGLNANPMVSAIEQLEGDYAISWVKDSNKIVHLARETSRPISIAYWRKAKTLIWASTDDILKKSLNRAGLNLQCVSLLSEYIYSFDTDKFARRYKPSKTKFNAKEKSYANTTVRYSHYNDYSYTGWQSCSIQSEIDKFNDSYDTEEIDAKDFEENGQCGMCLDYFRNEELIDIGDEEICWDCESDVDECSFCGDFMFFGEGTNINNNAITCESCKPSAASVLMLEESTFNGITEYVDGR